ncbi:sulfurtransferase TusA family protein [Oceanicola sp. 502str15]|uniref:sulfurtransferase TusA family protein n=1 Tax=Oceanicola sp. 502str15 TaxID=2696061 RepID=UPI002094E292|nr:sulfurtransferase TusA family protein [Oceanicola sp. 502str15]MCO6381927.1 preprotein translocase subunit TatB [Oceanicola sp. 502str15]
MTHHAALDATGLLCPLPVLKTARRLRALASGEVLRVETDDPAALIDMPHFCAESGHSLLSQEETATGMIWHLQKK